MPLRDKRGKRYSGALLAVSSLPSNYGIGTLGKSAYDFVDFLRLANQRYWQILPINPLGEGNSPYKSVSGFAGEMLYIDIDFLVRDGYLDASDIPETNFPQNTDYNAVYKFKIPLLKKAAENFDTKQSAFLKFKHDNAYWLDDYAIFCTAMQVYGTQRLTELPEGIKYRVPKAIFEFAEKHRSKIRFHKIMQYIFYRQYFELKRYANSCGVEIIGDIPFYVSPDSVDVWVNPDDFKVGRDFTPTAVAGVPPDKFSQNGQLWGNPIYNWKNMKKNDLCWWQRRLRFCKDLYDVIRIDHFRAFANFYSIPYGAKDARSGTWEKGIGISFWEKMQNALGNINIIAEDLGGEDDIDVQQMLCKSGFPNMKIMQFGFTGSLQNQFLPQNYKYNCVCYTGTHDNDTTLGWYNTATKKERVFFNALMGEDNTPVPHRMIKAAVKSQARMVIVPMQDLLCLDSSARMNTPGTVRGNWQWRMPNDALTKELAETFKALTKSRN